MYVETSAFAPRQPAMDTPLRRILIVEDHDLVRLGTRVVLSSLERVRCEITDCRTLDEVRRLAAAGEQYDAVLLDLNLCDAKGLQGLRATRELFPNAIMVVLTGTQDEFVVRQAKALGAQAYLLKSWSPDLLVAALSSLLAPQAPPMAVTAAASRFPKLQGSHTYDRVAELGARHIQILELVLSGCNNHEISTVTGLSLGTVKNYVSAILLALDVKSRAHLIALFH